MPYAPRLYRCNIQATRLGELIVNSVWVQRDLLVQGGDDMTQRIANRVMVSWTRFVGGTGNTPARGAKLFAQGTNWNTVECYQVGMDGKAVSQASAAFPANVSGQTTPALPPQVALVGSLLTGAPGRNARGRIYLGGLSMWGMSPEGRLKAAERGELLGYLSDFYRDIRDDRLGDDDFRPVVVSPTQGTARKITAVSVGDVYDTQRRRRNRLTEARAQATVDA